LALSKQFSVSLKASISRTSGAAVHHRRRDDELVREINYSGRQYFPVRWNLWDDVEQSPLAQSVGLLSRQ
jgi:hypothetical protein